MTKNRGAGFLYANTFYTREEFEAAFNVGKDSLYEKARRRSDRVRFPRVAAGLAGCRSLQRHQDYPQSLAPCSNCIGVYTSHRGVLPF